MSPENWTCLGRLSVNKLRHWKLSPRMLKPMITAPEAVFELSWWGK